MDIYGFIIVFLVLLFLRLPIGLVMITASMSYFIFNDNFIIRRQLLSLPENMFESLNVYVLTAIPFFLLAGEIMNRAQLTDKLFTFANLLIGRVRGGLAQVNIAASILFSGVTGVALGDVASLGKMFIPSMVRQGYPKAFSAALTAASSLVGPIIPPSTMIILYCSVTNTSVGAMFVAAIIPGIILGVSQMIFVGFYSHKMQFPKVEVNFTIKKFGVSFLDAALAILMPIVIIRSIILGWFSPTEAAAAAVVYTLFVGLIIFRTIKFGDLPSIFAVAAKDSARLFFIIMGAGMIRLVFSFEAIPDLVENAFQQSDLSFFALVILVNLFLLFCGMFLDPGVIIILFGSIFAAALAPLGMHPVQFGIMMIVNCVVGLCTPPIGNILFAVSNVANISIGALSKALFPFLILGFINVLLLGFWSDLTLWLPSHLELLER